MSSLSVSKVHFKDEDELWSYYDNCGLSPALTFTDGDSLDYHKVTYSLGNMFICSTSSASGWGFEKQQDTDVYFVTFTYQGESVWEMNKQGRVSASQQVCVVDSSRLVKGQFSRGTVTDTLMIEASALKREIESAQGFACADRIEFTPLLPANQKVWPHIRSLIDCIRGGFDQCGQMNSPLATTYLKHALMATIIESIPNNYSELGKLYCAPALPRHMSRAIEYVNAHASEDISINDVADYARTSVRNLQLGFRLHKNMTPMQYLRQVRLAAARSDLINEDVRITWQNIALRWGFSDISLFSRYYKEKYDESPFQTQYKLKGRLDFNN